MGKTLDWSETNEVLEIVDTFIHDAARRTLLEKYGQIDLSLLNEVLDGEPSYYTHALGIFINAVFDEAYNQTIDMYEGRMRLVKTQKPKRSKEVLKRKKAA